MTAGHSADDDPPTHPPTTAAATARAGAGTADPPLCVPITGNKKKGKPSPEEIERRRQERMKQKSGQGR
ncbi:hypothetical protein ABZ611_29875 [Streptomyces sp. NPDC007861]|uniref:hypothetical protein n=1 Tax=Streptomyces sp. NPDC007861 TaxID=3154893 RepID=UPI0033EF9D4A